MKRENEIEILQDLIRTSNQEIVNLQEKKRVIDLINDSLEESIELQGELLIQAAKQTIGVTAPEDVLAEEELADIKAFDFSRITTSRFFSF